MNRKPIEEVLEEHTDALMALTGVVGVAQGGTADDPCIRVFLEGTASHQEVPATLGGYPVRTETTGPFRPR